MSENRSPTLMPMSLTRLMSFITFYLCTAPCQFTFSKTTQCLQYISQIINEESEEYNNTHNISLILTNKSLEETKQWKSRLTAKFQNKKIVILSSKSKDHKCIDTINSSIMECILDEDYEELPNVIVMCTHSKRTDDCKKLLKFSTFYNSFLERNILINFTLMFDEADEKKNLKTIINFLQEINNLDKDILKYIKDCIFITATPLDDFWKKINSFGIPHLKNFKNLINSEYDISDIPKFIQTYQKIQEHNIIFTNDNSEPVAYAENILKKFENNKTRTVYAPSNTKRTTHDDMVEMAKKYGYDTLIINGKDKQFTINGIIEKIFEFNRKYNVEGELRDTLAKYRELYPNNNLLITGNICIERGITFNTTNFNFTDMIISPTIARNIASLIQFLGRASGGKKYVDKMDIWIPEHIYKTAERYINRQLELQTMGDKIEFRNVDFCDYDEELERNNNSTNFSRETIPYYFDLSNQEFKDLLNDRKRNGIRYGKIKNFINNQFIQEFNINEFHIARHIKEKGLENEFMKAKTSFENNTGYFCKFHTKQYEIKNTCHILLHNNQIIINFIYKIQ